MYACVCVCVCVCVTYVCMYCMLLSCTVGSSADDELESAETGFDDQMEDEPAEEFTFSRGPQSSDSSSGVEHDKSSDSGPDVPPRSTRAGKTDKKVSKRELHMYTTSHGT